MGTISKIEKVKLIMGVLYNDAVNIEEIYILLKNKFGKIDNKSSGINFNYTDYYNKEMGSCIIRQFISFEKLIEMENLAEIKILTNKIEVDNSSGCKRNINLDPGYIELGKLVLASTKNYTHRIYIGNGIFAEPTLQFFHKTFTKWPFSYPDYSDEFAIVFFNEVRAVYKKQL